MGGLMQIVRPCLRISEAVFDLYIWRTQWPAFRDALGSTVDWYRPLGEMRDLYSHTAVCDSDAARESDDQVWLLHEPLWASPNWEQS